jgi:hypothetical protein
MMQRHVAKVLVGIAIGLAGCKPTKQTEALGDAAASSSAASASSSAEARPPPIALDEGGPMKAIVADQAFSLPHGRATLSDSSLEIELASEHVDCEGDLRGARLRFNLYQGPGATYYTGKPHGEGLALTAPGESSTSFDVRAMAVRMTVQPFDPAKGSHVRGKLLGDAGPGSKMMSSGRRTSARYAAAGTFDVEICKDTRSKPPDRLGAPPPLDGAVRGTLHGERFNAGSAIAFVFKDAGLGVDYVSSIDFFAKPGVTCENRREYEGISLDVKHMGGARGDAPILGAPQPADAERSRQTKTPGGFKTESNSTSSREAWVTFERVALEANGAVTGTVVAVTRSDAKKPPKNDEVTAVGGHFSAAVCNLGEL